MKLEIDDFLMTFCGKFVFRVNYSGLRLSISYSFVRHESERPRARNERNKVCEVQIDLRNLDSFESLFHLSLDQLRSTQDSGSNLNTVLEYYQREYQLSCEAR